ncbi:MAG: hypothetical protein ACKOZT_11980 [Cyanobium sp.]
MADFRDEPRLQSRAAGGSSASLVLGVLSGAVLGAAGLGWWLFAEADRRRRLRPQPSLHSGEGRQPLSAAEKIPQLSQRLRLPRPAESEPALQERVQQLNQAIDEVRRQLEALQPQP